jgi:hypothetical protein
VFVRLLDRSWREASRVGLIGATTISLSPKLISLLTEMPRGIHVAVRTNGDLLEAGAAVTVVNAPAKSQGCPTRRNPGGTESGQCTHCEARLGL